MVSEVLRNENYSNLKKALGINETSVNLFFSSEGDTDKENYLNIVWDAQYNRVCQ